MTHLLAIAAGAITIAPVAWSVSRRRTLRDSDVVSYDIRRDWRAIAEQADHDHRNARRWGEALTAMRAIHDDIVGDLLDTVAEQARQLEQLQTPQRRDPIPPYGPRRQAA